MREFLGLDLSWIGRKNRAKLLGIPMEYRRFVNGVRTSYIADMLCEAGHMGRKAGGSYDTMIPRYTCILFVILNNFSKVMAGTSTLMLEQKCHFLAQFYKKLWKHTESGKTL